MSDAEKLAAARNKIASMVYTARDAVSDRTRVDKSELLLDELNHYYATEDNRIAQLTADNARLTKEVEELRKAWQQNICELMLCESQSLVLKPDQLYIFKVASGCKECQRIESDAAIAREVKQDRE